VQSCSAIHTVHTRSREDGCTNVDDKELLHLVTNTYGVSISKSRSFQYASVDYGETRITKMMSSRVTLLVCINSISRACCRASKILNLRILADVCYYRRRVYSSMINAYTSAASRHNLGSESSGHVDEAGHAFHRIPEYVRAIPTDEMNSSKAATRIRLFIILPAMVLLGVSRPGADSVLFPLSRQHINIELMPWIRLSGFGWSSN